MADLTKLLSWSHLGVVLFLSACGGAAGEASVAPTLSPPDRTAAEDESLRMMLLDVAEAHLCERLEGSFVALPDADAAGGTAGGSSPSAGRLWIESCAARRDGRRLSMQLGGRGWTWVERSSAGPMGTSYTVRGHLKFETEIDLLGEVDAAYAEDRRLVSVWLTPRSPAAATVTPTGAVPVEPDGGWSSFIGAVGGVFGPSVEERARPMVEEQGSTQMSERLSAGFTFTVDLCTGQADSMVGPLPNAEVPQRPYAADGVRWLANQRVRLRASGLDVSGPFTATDSPLHVDYEVEEGPAIDVRAHCVTEASGMVDAFLRGEALPEGAAIARHRVEPNAPTFLEVDASECPVVLVVTPAEDAREQVVFRYRAFPLDATAEPVVRCE